jgi:hypothetical protein
MNFKEEHLGRSWWLTFFGAVAVLFGVATVISGRRVLFGGASPRLAAGAYVPFVPWFNFLSGFLYGLAGIGLILGHRGAAHAAVVLVGTSLIVFAAFGLHIANGGAFEPRTVAAMTFRAVVWLIIAGVACCVLSCRFAKRRL